MFTSQMTDEGKRPQFGGRSLEGGVDVFQHNAWDNVEWGAEQEEEAERVVAGQGTGLGPELARQHEESQADSWDQFYSGHTQ